MKTEEKIADNNEEIKNEKEPASMKKCKKMNDDYCVLGIEIRETNIGGLNAADEEAIGTANLCNFNYKRKMKPLKKRGRKPMKARSLKSLLSFRVC